MVGYHCFGGLCCHHCQGDVIGDEKQGTDVGLIALQACIYALFFYYQLHYPEDGGSKVLQNVGIIPQH